MEKKIPGDIAKNAVNELIKQKNAEMEQYYLDNRDIIKPFLLLRKEIEELESRRINISLNQSEWILANVPPRKPNN